MNVKECYEKIKGNYEEVLGRLLNDERIRKYLKKYMSKNELDDLRHALEEKRYQDAFLHAHNMKGFSLNLSLTQLYTASNDLCEILRSGNPEVDTEPLYRQIEQVHETMFDAIKELED